MKLLYLSESQSPWLLFQCRLFSDSLFNTHTTLLCVANPWPAPLTLQGTWSVDLLCDTQNCHSGADGCECAGRGGQRDEHANQAELCTIRPVGRAILSPAPSLSFFTSTTCPPSSPPASSRGRRRASRPICRPLPLRRRLQRPLKTRRSRTHLHPSLNRTTRTRTKQRCPRRWTTPRTTVR